MHINEGEGSIKAFSQMIFALMLIVDSPICTNGVVHVEVRCTDVTV